MFLSSRHSFGVIHVLGMGVFLFGFVVRYALDTFLPFSFAEIAVRWWIFREENGGYEMGTSARDKDGSFKLGRENTGNFVEELSGNIWEVGGERESWGENKSVYPRSSCSTDGIRQKSELCWLSSGFIQSRGIY